MIDYLGLGPVMHARAGDLPFGTQKRIELARALAMRPKLLLLDEPACGLNHEEVASLGTLIRRIRSELELTVLLVEHHMQLVMSVCERIVALNFGRKLAEGTPAEIRSNADVVAAYLGTQEHA
jgi:branched-chain amino acid transport system ATP-binding protein